MQISIADASAAEDAGVLTFMVSLSAQASGAVTVDYVTADGTASAGQDYQSASGNLSIPAGSTSGTIEVSLIDDGDDEPDETFTLTLSNPSSNATIATAAATGTITDDDGWAGFELTKLAADGAPLADHGADYASTPWACVRDEVTGLVWEVKTDDDGLQDRDWTYTWYDMTAPNAAFDPGTAAGGTCAGSGCDTSGFVEQINQAGLCGFGDWRVPTRRELLSLVHFGTSEPLIDTAFFPNTAGLPYWSSTVQPAMGPAFVSFGQQGSAAASSAEPLAVRLVRGEEHR